MNPKVDWFFDKKSKWQDSYSELRQFVLSTGLNEELKWGCPCYTNNKSNIVLIHGFKDYCALLFMQGALLKDPDCLLIQQTENVQSARQLRFSSLEDVLDKKETIISYVNEAIENDKKSLKVELKKINDYKIPVEFQTVLNEMPDVKTAFQSLSLGRQKSYIFYFGSAKQAKTREARVEKYVPKILDGKGMDD